MNYCVFLSSNSIPICWPAGEAKRFFALRVPRAFVARMEKGNLDDPLLKQTLTAWKSSLRHSGYSTDPLEEQNSVVPGLLHKYRTVLLLVKGWLCGKLPLLLCRHFPVCRKSGQ